MKLIVGLGNPGEKYAYSRHNIGFLVVDRLSRELGSSALVWQQDDKHKSQVAKTGDILLVKPLTFVNNTGIAVASLTRFYKLTPVDIWVVHDDIDLPLGKIRIRTGGGSAGHNGVESIMEHVKTDAFVRFRLGVGKGVLAKGPTMDKKMHHRSVIDFVLSRFTWHEAGELKHLVKRGAQAVRIALVDGIDRAMNRFN